MDCPSEENLIRMKFEVLSQIKHLKFDLNQRELTIFHDNNIEEIEERWPLGAGELDGTTNPFELGLSPWVHLNKGCYLGQETVAKLASKGEVKQQLRSWRALSSDLQGTHPERGTVLRRQGDRAGVITSAVEIASADGSPQEWIGLALVRRQALADPQLTLDGEQGTIQLFKPQAFSEPPSRA